MNQEDQSSVTVEFDIEDLEDVTSEEDELRAQAKAKLEKAERKYRKSLGGLANAYAAKRQADEEIARVRAETAKALGEEYKVEELEIAWVDPDQKSVPEIEAPVEKAPEAVQNDDLFRNVMDELKGLQSTEVATVEDRWRFSERLRDIAGENVDALVRLKKLDDVLTDMGTRALTTNNIESHAADLAKIQNVLHEVTVQVAPVEHALGALKEDRKVVKAAMKKWNSRVQKAEKAHKKALEEGFPVRAGEIQKLIGVAQATAEKMATKKADLERDITTVSRVQHDINMTRTRLLTLVISGSKFLNGSVGADQQAINGASVMLSRVSGAINAMERESVAKSPKAIEA